MKAFFIGIAILGILVVLSFVGLYNQIVTKHETVTAQWAQVENQLQRRNDLIPNLVNSVKGYTGYEKGVLENVTAARSQWAGAKSPQEKIQAASTMDGALARLLAVVENYPTLKADQTFLQLMDELSGTENRVAVERMRYNQAVRDYNIVVRTFPGNIVSSLARFKPAGEYFKAEEKTKAVPEVKF
jgi:LemA protein